jgi:hypothetical protein
MNAKVILALTLARVGLLNFHAQGAEPESGDTIHTAARSTPAFPLELSADRRYLVDQNDQPFLVIGDSPWSLIVEPTPAQVDLYLDDRAAKGFNLLLVNLLEHKFSMQPTKLDYVATARTSDGTLALSFLPATGTAGRELIVDLNQLAGPVTANWFNPTDGRLTPVPGSPFANSGPPQLKDPGDNGSGTNDWLLILETTADLNSNKRPSSTIRK